MGGGGRVTQDEMCIGHTVLVVGLSVSVGSVEASAVGLVLGTGALGVDSEVTTTRDMGGVLQITGIRTYTT